MKPTTGYLYHLISGIILLIAAFTIWLKPEYTGNLSSGNQKFLLLMLSIWGLFPFMHIRSNENNEIVKKKIDFTAVLLILLLCRCGDISYAGKGKDVPTAGEVLMAVDYGDSFAINEELEMFHLNYPKAHITAVHLCENEIFRLLESDSLHIAVVNRDLTAKEKENLELKDIKVRSYEIGRTAIALIVSKQTNTDSISVATLRSLFEGGEHVGINKLVFDESCGSNLLYFKDSWFNGTLPHGHLLQKSTPREVIRYISETPGAVGFVNVNWLSDRMDQESKKLASGVKVLRVENSKTGGFHLPFQSQIAARQYPFVQHVFIHDLQGYSGLAQGFTAFAGSQPGQLIIKKSGLLPAHDMGRTIELVND